jgi:hypothetical protein
MQETSKSVMPSRAFATRKYPLFGKGAYSEANPPKGVVSSPFYWWFKFLQQNDEYAKALVGKRSQVPKQLVKDFGAVTDTDFKTWWKAHGHLFAEPSTSYSMTIAKVQDDLAPFDSKDAINLVIPLDWTNVGIKRRFSQVIDKLVPKAKKGQAIQPSSAPYKLGRKWSIVAFTSAYNVYMLKQLSLLQVKQGGQKIPWADIAIMAKLNAAGDLRVGQKTKFTSDHRRTLTILAKRHYARAEEFISAAASSSFPHSIKLY